MRYHRRNGPEFRCSWDEWLLSCQFLTSIQTFDSIGVRKDSATQVLGVRSQKLAASQDLTPATRKAKRQDRPPAVSLCCKKSGPYLPLLTTFFSSFPGVNLATLRAAILMVAPVCGFRPLRALRCETENVPKPIKATRSPFLRAAVTLSTVVSIAVVACAFEILQAPAIRSTRSALFMLSPDTNRFGSRAFSRGGKLKARAPTMAILAHAVGLSMGNTCQLPLLTPKANG